MEAPKSTLLTVAVTGRYDSATKELCLSGDTDIRLPGVETKMSVTTCLDMTTPSAPIVKAATFGGRRARPHAG